MKTSGKGRLAQKAHIRGSTKMSGFSLRHIFNMSLLRTPTYIINTPRPQAIPLKKGIKSWDNLSPPTECQEHRALIYKTDAISTAKKTLKYSTT